MKCNLGRKKSPDFLTLYEKSWNSLLHSATNIFQVTRIKPTDVRTRNFTVCFSPLHGNITTNQFVESMELNQIFGADHFIVYNSLDNSSIPNYGRFHSSSGVSGLHSAPIQAYLDYYTQKRLASVHSWKLPEEVHGKVHYFGQMAALNDCLYKNRYSSKYIVCSDIDEIIVPQKTNSWTELLWEVTPKNANTIGSYSFQNVFFKANGYSDNAYAHNPIAKEYNILSLLKTQREKEAYNHRNRSKLIVMPERVSVAGIHYVHEFIDNFYYEKNITNSQAMLYHYRHHSPSRDAKTIHDRHMHQLAEQIVNRITTVHKEVNRIT